MTAARAPRHPTRLRLLLASLATHLVTFPCDSCSLLVAAGLLTRLAAVPIVFTMLMVLTMAARGFAGADVQSALLYALPDIALALTGAGRYSLDHRLRARYRRFLARLVPP